jgi:hypothetical protein
MAKRTGVSSRARINEKIDQEMLCQGRNAPKTYTITMKKGTDLAIRFEQLRSTEEQN